MILSVVQNMASNCKMINEYELKRAWKEAVVAYFQVISLAMLVYVNETT